MTSIAVEPATVRGLRREEYERLVDLGCFADERVELLYGTIVRMSPANDPHAYAVEQLSLALIPLAIEKRARVRIQSPMAASEVSEPEPDVLVTALDDRPGRHPGGARLVVEVAESSLRIDRGVKASLYAEAGVPEYWVVNLPGRCVEVFTQPSAGAYTERRQADVGESLRPLAFPDVVVSVAALFA